MKKIMSDKSFWIILIVSIITLISLTVGVIFLTRQNIREFYSAGYIINSTATKTDKYYFDDNTIYKENVFDEYVFTDVDNNEVSTGKDNFIHYLDNSLSFMKNGVILDLDNFNENIVPYYNITDKSIVQYNNGGYYIETADKTLVFGNFLGRITDNKYIVVGNDISVKLAGNDDTVKGDYFEILFVEDGIVKIENQEGSYQTISDGSVVYVDDDIKINLGDKSLNYGDEIKLNLTELTIDGNENIDIIPEDGLVDKNENSGGGTGTGDGDGTGSGSGDGTGTGDGDGTGSGSGDGTGSGAGDGTGSGSGDGTGTGDGDGTGSGSGDGTGTGDGDGTGSGSGDDEKIDGETTTVIKKEVAVNLIEASSTVNSINAKFQVIDTMNAIKGNLVLSIVNTTTGETVYTKILANTPEEQPVYVTSLASDCNYVMTIVDENNETSTQYFQKSFRTDSLNLRLRREMVTETSLSYSLDFGTQSDVTKADVSICDEEGNELGRYSLEKGTDSIVTFEGLDHNTLYTVVVDNVVIKNVLENRYSSRTSDLTLKNKPILGDVSVKTNDDVKNFTLKMDSVTDEDSSIVQYTYQIFKAADLTEETMNTAVPVYSFNRNELDEEILKLDENKNLYGNTDYRFKIVAKYFDNYRYNEIETKYSDYFQIVGKPMVYFEPTVIDINRIAGIVTFEDVDCTIPFEGRECFDEPNNFSIRYYGGKNSNKNEIEGINVDDENMSLSFDLTGLEEDTEYTFEVYANVDFHNGNGLNEGHYIGEFEVSTTGINALIMQNWKKNGYSYDIPLSVNTEMVSTNPEDESIDNLATITFNLYSGDVKSYIERAEPIASFTVTENVKDRFYNKEFSINSNMFEYFDEETSQMYNIENLSVLKELSGGTLNRHYTIAVVDAFDDTTPNPNEFPILNNVYVYDTPSILLLEDQVSPPEIVVEEITNTQTQSGEYSESYGVNHISDLDGDIVRGYKVTAVFEKNKIESYFPTGNPITKINFYAHDSKGILVEQKTIEFADNEEYTMYFFLGDGTDYNTTDKDLRRGNTYTFSYDLSINDDGDYNTEELVFPASRPVSDKCTSVKQAPLIKYYIDNSTDTSITYKYQVYDYDNALYSEDGKYYIHYNVVGFDEEYTTEFVRDGSSDVFTLSNLSNGVIYNIGYYNAVVKDVSAAIVNTGSYYFDGYYNLDDTLKYKLERPDNSNELKIIIEDNEFLNRVSAYLLTMTADGVNNKYQKVISNLDSCGENKCIIVNYKDLNTTDIPFKGKNITVKLDAFYDTGFVGFGQDSKLNDYFENLGYDLGENYKVGYVYQTTGTSGAGKYFNNIPNNPDPVQNPIVLYDTPKGIIGFELVSTNSFKATWKLNTSNLIDTEQNKFILPEDVTSKSTNVITSGPLGSVNIVGGVTVNPKVLDKISVTTDYNDNFKFTSIIPSVSVENVKSLINGVTMKVIPSVDSETLKTDYVATDGKYKFYIDVYQVMTCPPVIEGEEPIEECVSGGTYEHFLRTVPTDYDSLDKVSFIGLDPATTYKYEISADMNINGNKVPTILFDNVDGRKFKGEFTTLTKNQIFDSVRYNYKSTITEETYSDRKLYFDTYLNKNYAEQLINFDLKFTLSNENGQEFVTTDINGQQQEFLVIKEEDITRGNNIIASYVHDVTGDDFVFGSRYHELVITAVTTDLGRELELYRGTLEYDGSKHFFGMLDTFVDSNFTGHDESTFLMNINNTAEIDVENDIHYIESKIMVTDTDKVIKDGKFYIRLQDIDENNLLICQDGDEACKLACSATEDVTYSNNPCRLTISISKKKDEKTGESQLIGTCDGTKFKNVTSCTVDKLDNNNYSVIVKFNNLKADSFYSIYVYADTFANNYNNGYLEPVGIADARKNQYTKGELGFSLGGSQADYKNDKLSILYADSANLDKSLVGVKYSITKQGGSKLTEGELGVTTVGVSVTGEELNFSKDEKGNLLLDIDLNNNKLTPDADKEDATIYLLNVTYYYKDNNGKSQILQFGSETKKLYYIPIK